MRCSRFVKGARIIAGLVSVMLLGILAVPANASPADDSHWSYDVTREVTLTGTVSAVLTQPASGMILGSHLLLTTPSGTIDASLGRWGLEGKGAVSVVAGEQVEVTGVTTTFNNKEVFIVRTVKVNGKTYTVRNQHGIDVSPQTRERAAQKGETL